MRLLLALLLTVHFCDESDAMKHNDGNLRNNMKKWQAVANSALFISRVQKVVEAKDGSFNSKEIDDTAVLHAGKVIAAVNKLRTASTMVPLNAATMSIQSYTTQAVAGTKHCFCMIVDDLDMEDQQLNFQGCWVVPADQTTPFLDNVVPNTVIMKNLGVQFDQYKCSTVTFEEAEDVGLIEESNKLSALIEAHLHKNHAPPPLSYDFRQASPKCVDVLEMTYNQGSCGSCYAFSAAAAAAARACAAGHVLWSKKLSTQDTLACGTQMSGHMCVNYKGGAMTTNFANGCDGGKSSLVDEFATIHGLMEDPCGPNYEWSGDPTTHWTPGLECRLQNRGDTEVNIKCKEGRSTWSLDLPTTGTIRADKLFCQCSKKMRSGYEKVEVLVANAKTECKGRKLVVGPAKITCQDGMKIHRSANANAGDKIGSTYNFGEDGMDYCRCAHSHLTMEPKNSFKLFEDGLQATKTETCRRYKNGKVRSSKIAEVEAANGGQSCEPKKIFHSPTDASGITSELLMQHAIMDGGPIVASLQAYDDLSNFNGKGVYSVSASAQPSGGHAVVIFGWGHEAETKQPFWWVKNSWGNHPTAMFKYIRKKDEGGIESRGSSWLYANPKSVAHLRRPFCPESIMKTESKTTLVDSCLKLVETSGGLYGIGEEPSCKIQNICSTGDDLPVISYSLNLQTTKSTCGSRPVFPRTLAPGESYLYSGYMRCCVDMEERTGKVYKMEPGNCMKSTGRGALQNICTHAIELRKGLDSNRFFSFAAGDEFNIRFQAGDSYFSTEEVTKV